MKNIFTVFSFSMRELLRSKIFYALLVFLLVSLWISLFIGSLSLESKFEIASDLAVAGSVFFAALSAIALAVEYVGVILTPLFRHFLVQGLKREELVIGRLFAVGLIVLVLSFLPAFAFYITFSLLGGETELLPIKYAVILIPLEALLIFFITSALAISYPKPLAFSLGLGLWIACHLHPDPLAIQIIYSGITKYFLLFVENIAPDLEIYNPRLIGNSVGTAYFASFFQTFSYSAISVFISVLSFRKKEL